MNIISNRFIAISALLALMTSNAATESANEALKFAETSSIIRSKANLFAMDVFNAIVPKQFDRNIIISPLYIRNVVAMLYAGAGYNTANELRRLLRFNSSNSKLENQKELRDIFQYQIPSAKVHNNFYVSKSVHILPQYYDMVLRSLNVRVKKVDFKKPPIAQLNNTGLVQHKDDVTNIAAMIENTIEFESKWLYKFKNNTRRIFTQKGGRESMINMMHLIGKFRYMKSLALNAKFLELKFNQRGMSMLLMLPDDRDSLQDLELSLKREDVEKVFGYMRARNIEVFLPKFSIDYSVDLEKIFVEMGVSNMFGPNADFSDLFLNAGPSQVSKVFRLKHTTHIQINNSGAKHSSMGISNIKPYSADVNRVIEFNHPFAYFIHDRKKIIFAGHVAKP